MDIKKLKALQPKLELEAQKERLENYLLSVDQIENYIEFEKARKKVSQSPRVLNNWVEQGVINPIETGKKRTFNKMESIWFNLIIELKEFGLRLDKIKKVKEYLFESPESKSDFTPLKYALTYSIIIEPYILMVYKDGSVNLMSKTDYSKYILNDNIIPIHICINLLDISQDEFPKNNFNDIGNFTEIGLLSEKELELLYYLRTGEYDEIKVRMEDGLIYLIESSSKLNVDSKIIDIINTSSYQDIQIKVRDGKTVLIKSTELKK